MNIDNKIFTEFQIWKQIWCVKNLNIYQVFKQRVMSTNYKCKSLK
jgi:hypothetical protein